MRTLEPSKSRRNGNATLLTACLLICVTLFTTIATDIRFFLVAKSEAQRFANQAAIVGVAELVNDDRLRGEFDSNVESARQKAKEFVRENQPSGQSSILATPYINLAREISVGKVDQTSAIGGVESPMMSFDAPHEFNALTVDVRLANIARSPSPLIIGRILGFGSFSTRAESTAMFATHVRGFATAHHDDCTSLLPIAVQRDVWQEAIVDGLGPDEWRMDGEQPLSGGDGIREMALSLEADVSNSAALRLGDGNLSSQIRDGVSGRDLALHNGSLVLDESGNLRLRANGSRIADSEASIVQVIGHPRTIALYESAEVSDSITTLVVTGFVGIRIVACEFHADSAFLTVQPTFVSDDSAVIGDGPGESHYVGRLVQLTR